MKLEEWRGEIDEIDGEIVTLLERRAKISRKIGLLKANAGLAIADPAREEKIVRQLAAKSSGALPGESLARIYHRILQESRLIQMEVMAHIPKDPVKNSIEVYQ